MLDFIYDHTLRYIYNVIIFIMDLIFTDPKYQVVFDKFRETYWDGIKVTLNLAILGTIIGFTLALFLAPLREIHISEKDTLVAKVSKKIGKIFSKIYVTVVRGTPMIIQAMIIYYGLRKSGVNIEPMSAGLMTVSLNTTAYLTEVLRGGLKSLDKGQYEAARAIGFTRFKTMRHVVYPQVIKNSIPSIGNELIVNVKDTAVLSVILVVDLFRAAQIAGGSHFIFFEAMIIAGIFYLILTYSLTKLLGLIEKKLDLPKSEIVSSN